MSRDGGSADAEVDDGLSNEEFRLLVERAHNAGDHEATEELTAYLLSKIFSKARVFAYPEREDVATILLLRGWRVARTTLHKPIEKPRNYVVRSIGNAFVDYIRKRKAAPEGVEIPSGDASKSRPDRDGSEGLQDAANAADIGGLRRYCKTATQFKVVQVIELVYKLGISESEAYVLLDFSPQEIQAVRKALQRWRKNPRSPLNNFRDDEQGS